MLAGDDVMAAPLLALGAAGGILASAHLCTGRWAAMVDAWRAGDARQARCLGAPLAPLAAALFAEPNPTVIKAVLHATGPDRDAGRAVAAAPTRSGDGRGRPRRAGGSRTRSGSGLG